MAKDLLAFRNAIITGGGSGIGKEIAKWLLEQDKKVILAGRTEAKLEETSKEFGGVPYYVLDTGKIQDIPDFVERVTREHPDVDCLINNAGVQRPLIIDGMELDKADQEIDINIRGPMHLTVALLPHLKLQPNGLVVNISSVLGFVPFSIINPVYNGTKAWLHAWTMTLRTQLAHTNIGVLEIVPPTVSTDLHRERDDPDDNKKEKNSAALSVEEFMQNVAEQWQKGVETIGAGMSEAVVQRWMNEFGPDYEKAAKTWQVPDKP